jgi:YfiH family protein
MDDKIIHLNDIKLMIKAIKEEITFCKSKKLNTVDGVTHFFSTRDGGVSTGVFRSLNFGTHHGEADNMAQNLEILRTALRAENIKFIIPKQTHSDIIAVIDHQTISDSLENTDAVITNLPQVMVCVKTADCVPILLVDPEKRVVGAVHAGWRGTAQNIVGKTIEKMRQVFGSNPLSLIAAIGPCIGPSNYEVGLEVIMAIESQLNSPEKAIEKKEHTNNKFLLNLTEANFQLLTQAGLKGENIDLNYRCTYSNSQEFFSARRDGHKTGRMLNGIGIIT